jgi:hypothetical protein
VEVLRHVPKLPRQVRKVAATQTHQPRHRQVHCLQQQAALWEMHHPPSEGDPVTKKKNGININGPENRNGLSQMAELTKKVCYTEDLLATSISSISKDIARIS